ncbi:MAG TPA: hypothetical protein DEA50_17215 [Parvularcula sp.]|nr:hypothetical protein [Parvularcula sp.]
MTEGGAGAAALKPHWIGHRERLRRRFLQAGIEGVADYELLEMILYRAKARGDVKPLAKAILKKFGGFAPALAAPIERLVEIDGVGEATAIEMKIIHAAAVKLAQARVLGRPVIASWEELLAYCRSAMADQKIEEFRILFLDKKNILIADEVQQRGTVDHTPVYPREVLKRALELTASAIILVHNHPSGDPTPSRADIDMTNQIIKAATPLGVRVHDHLVIGHKGEVSFKSLGLI